MDTPGMKMLKAAVVIMGLLLVAGTTLLVIRVQERQERANASDKVPELSQLTLAPKGWVVMMAPLGDGLALLVDSMDTRQEVVILDRQGGLLRRIRLEPMQVADEVTPDDLPLPGPEDQPASEERRPTPK